MIAVGVVRFMIIVQLLGTLCNGVSEKLMMFNWKSKDIEICYKKSWLKYYATPSIEAINFLTVDVKRRVLYWNTKKEYFSLTLDGNKTLVNLSQKFGKGLLYQGFLQSAVAVQSVKSMEFRVYDGQIIFAARNWGLMKFDVTTNKKLYSFKAFDITQYKPLETLMNIDTLGDVTYLYWHGSGMQQISRYNIDSNTNEIVIEGFDINWNPVVMYQNTIFWADTTYHYFKTDINFKNKESTIPASSSIGYAIYGGIFYYVYERNISSQLLRTVYPLSLCYIPCRQGQYYFFNYAVVPAASRKDSDDHNVNNGIWSTIGWSLGCACTILILLVVCFKLVKMIWRRPRPKSNSPVNTNTNVLDMADYTFENYNNVYSVLN